MFGRASCSDLDDYFLFRNNYNNRKTGYVPVKILLFPKGSEKYIDTQLQPTKGHKVSPHFSKSAKLKLTASSFLIISKELHKVGYIPPVISNVLFPILCY